MRILFLGDVMGRSGRTAIAERLGPLRASLRADFCVVNAENASGGMGLTGDHARALLAAGADVLTLGDHAFDHKDMLQFIETEPRVVRPLNYARGAPGRGARVVTLTESQTSGCRVRSTCTTLPFPTPDGPDRTVSRPEPGDCVKSR